MSPTIRLDLTGMVGGQVAPITVDRATAAHEARHLAAAAIVGPQSPVHATAVANPGEGYAGQVIFDEPFITKDEEMTDAEWRAHAVTLIVGGLGEPGWPPDYPQVIGARTDDEWRLRVIVDRLGLDEEDRREIWHHLKAEARSLADDAPFQLLEAAYTGLLLDGRELDEHAIRAVRNRILLKEPAMPTTHAAEASSTAVGGRGRFAVLADMTGPQRQAIAGPVAQRKASGRAIPAVGITGEPIGTIDPGSLQDVPGFGLFFKGELHMERAEAADTWRRVRANRISVSYTPDLAAITLIPKIEPTDDNRPFTFSDELAAISDAIHAIRGRPEPVDPRYVIQVERDAGAITPEFADAKLEAYDLMRQAMSLDHAPPADELRRRADEITRGVR